MARFPYVYAPCVILCDWDRPGPQDAPCRGTWLSFGPSPVNLVEHACLAASAR